MRFAQDRPSHMIPARHAMLLLSAVFLLMGSEASSAQCTCENPTAVELDRIYSNPGATGPDDDDAYFVPRVSAAPNDGMDEDYYFDNGFIGGCYYRDSEVKTKEGVVVGWIYGNGC